MSRKRFVAGNWKMNGSLSENERLIAGIKEQLKEPTAEVVIFPPTLYIPQVTALVAGSGIKVGAQNIAAYQSGAYTGEVSGAMLKESGCEYVLVGHSERRELFGESDEVVATKFERALAEGLMPVLCLGESAKEREAGETEAVIRRQLTSVIEQVGIDAFKDAVIAYEPIWAIGTGKSASPEDANNAHKILRCTIEKYSDKISPLIRIVYGGSVNGDSAPTLFNEEEVDGALIGGASLKAEEFSAIAQL